MPNKTLRATKKMRKAQSLFDRYRKAHAARRPLPETLWKMAAELARQHGVSPTATALRLDYSKLKTLAGACVNTHTKGTRKTPPPAFVELPLGLAPGSAECLIELEGPRGKMRIQWKGATAADLAGVLRGVWEPV